jgi:hypothetical protein
MTNDTRTAVFYSDHIEIWRRGYNLANCRHIREAANPTLASLGGQVAFSLFSCFAVVTVLTIKILRSL